MWKVKIDRPEEMYDSPVEYYTKQEVEKYARSKSMKMKQEKMTARLLELMDISSPSTVLDLGCGPGYSTKFLEKAGFSAMGIDIIPEMLEKAKKKGLKVAKVDMEHLGEVFKEDSFDHVISVSALQWMKPGGMKNLAKGLSKALKKKGKFGAQFFPKSEKEMRQTGKIFSKHGFRGEFVVDNPGSPRKRRVFMVLQFFGKNKQ